MNINDIFTFTAHNGVEVTAVVVNLICYESARYNPEIKEAVYICYAQNRLFRCYTLNCFGKEDEAHYVELPENNVIADYCIIPEYDAMLEAEQQKFDDDCYEALSSIGDINF